MCMTMEDNVCAGSVDSLGQQIAAQKGIDLYAFTLQRVLHRRIVEKSNLYISLHGVERCLELLCANAGVIDEHLHLGLTELSRTRSSEPAAESFYTRDRYRCTVRCQRDRFTFKNLHTRILKNLSYRILGVLVIVVVAEHSHYRYIKTGYLSAENLGLGGISNLRQVAGQKKKIGRGLQLTKLPI